MIFSQKERKNYSRLKFYFSKISKRNILGHHSLKGGSHLSGYALLLGGA